MYPSDQAVAKAEASLKARKRKYPKFVEGTSTKQYVHDYYLANAMRWVPTSFGIQRGAYTDIHERVKLRAQVDDFFQPLSDSPQFTPIEETEACAS